MNPSSASTYETVSPEKGSKNDMRLHGRWVNLARCVWAVLIVLALGLFVASIPTYYASLHILNASSPPSVGGQLTPHDAQTLEALALTIDFYAWYNVVSAIVLEGVFLVVGLLIFVRKSDDRMALLASFTLTMFPFSLSSNSLSTGLPQSWLLAIRAVSFLSNVSFYLFFYLFPDGRFVPSWTRWLALGMVAFEVVNTFFPSLPFNQSVLPFVIFLGLTASVVVVQVYRYRRVSTPMQRQQTKWVVFGVSLATIGFLTAVVVLFLVLPPFFHSDRPHILSILILSTIASLLLYLIPISIAMAILRSRLFDIDTLTNRTLVYGLLTAFVIGLYILIVVGLSTVFEVQGNLVLSLAATALIAVLFQPLRDRLQQMVNRLMYGERDDPYRILSRLGQRLEGTLAPEQVLPMIVETTAQALKLPYVAITLKQDDAFVPAASYGTPAADLVHLELSSQREQVGELLLAPRAPGEALTRADYRLLTDLARQVGVAVYAVRLTTDLQRLARELQHSRTELVTTREEERRRLRRDLHDGLGSVLTSLNLRAGAIRTLLGRDLATAEALVLEQQNTIRSAIADIRRLVYDLRPPALDELGLLGAIRERAAHYGLPVERSVQQERLSGLSVEVQAPEDVSALPAALEVATYRIVQEALSNVARHAHARTCTIRLALSEGILQVEITDDGIGLPPAHRGGVGLLSMRERAAELGGTCEIEATPGGGTQVCARLPVLTEA